MECPNCQSEKVQKFSGGEGASYICLNCRITFDLVIETPAPVPAELPELSLEERVARLELKATPIVVTDDDDQDDDDLEDDD